MKPTALYISAAIFLFSTQVSCRPDSYRAAVVEFHPTIERTDYDTMMTNAARYVDFIIKAKQQKADIIVFPEGGLATTIKSQIPDPVDEITPSTDIYPTSEAVKKISKAAKDNQIYVVVNLLEERKNENNPLESFTYNTNVVFDRNGKVIARYAKYNLFDESLTQTTTSPEMVFFDTDFGVRFGTFTCFDILFSMPTQRLVQQYNIKDFVFPTYWFSELPFLTALQAQRGWAETNNVNLLASGVNNPGRGSTGSGIYNGKFGEIVQMFTEDATSKLLVANVPKFEDSCRANALTEKTDKAVGDSVYDTPNVTTSTKTENAASGLNLLDDQIYLYESEIIDPSSTFESKVCSNRNFCCDFYVVMDAISPHSKNYTYRAVAFNGVRKFGQTFRGGVQSCGVIACNGPDIKNCTKRISGIDGMFNVKEIRIKGLFNLRNSFQMPSTLTDGKEMKPLAAYKYEFQKKETPEGLEVSLELLWPTTNLQTFAIWGRDFTRDNEPSIPQSGASSLLTFPILIMSFVAFLVYS